MNSPGGINNHPVIIRAQYGSVDAGYTSGGLQPNPARTIVLELERSPSEHALVSLGCSHNQHSVHRHSRVLLYFCKE